MATLAHLSDLHLGASRGNERAAAALVSSLVSQGVDHVVVTGDVTDGGRMDEYEQYLELFAPLRRRGRVTVVPGNHDRSGDDVGDLLSDGHDVSVTEREGLYLVRVDSTAPHNRTRFRAHGRLCEERLAAVDRALDAAPRGALVGVLLHHHLLPLPVEGVGEWFAERFGWPHAAELPLGRALLQRVRGRCDLVLHGHRHVPRHWAAEASGARKLEVANAGSSTALNACRVFRHQAGRVLGVHWLEASLRQRPRARLQIAVAALQLG